MEGQTLLGAVCPSPLPRKLLDLLRIIKDVMIHNETVDIRVGGSENGGVGRARG